MYFIFCVLVSIWIAWAVMHIRISEKKDKTMKEEERKILANDMRDAVVALNKLIKTACEDGLVVTIGRKTHHIDDREFEFILRKDITAEIKLVISEDSPREY